MLKNRTFWLLLVNVLLAVFIIFNFEEEPSQEVLVNGLTTDILSQLEKIELICPEKNQSLLIENENSNWIIKKPFYWKVQTVGISNLFSQLNHLNPKFLFPSDLLIQRGEIASDYGFNEKSVTLRLIGKGKSLEYTFGNHSRDENSRYLQITTNSSSSIWQCPKQIYELLNQSFIEWAEPTFFNIPLYTIDAFFFSEYKDGQIASESHVEKKLSKWQITLPFQSYADEEEVLHLLHSFSSESIVGFVDSSLDELNTTKVLESCFKTSNELVRFTFHKFEDVNLPHLLVNSSLTKQNFWVRSDFIESVRNLPSRLREKRLFGIDSTDVERIKITNGNQSITLRHQEKDNWIGLEDNTASSNSFIADALPIKQLIHNLNLVSVTNFTIFDPTPEELAKQGFNSPRFKLEIDLKNSTSKKVLISKSNSESSLWNTYIVNQALVCLVNTQWDKLLSTKLIDFQSREMLPAHFFTQQINFKNLETNETVFKFSEDHDFVSFSKIENLRAESFIESKYNEEGVWINGDWLPWKYSLSFQGNGEKDFPEIIFQLTGQQGATKWYSGFKELNLVFNLPVSIIDELFKVLPSTNSLP